MRTRTKKRRKRRIGSSLLLLIALCSPLSVAQKRKAEAYAVVAGTVFREPGFALPGADVTVTPHPGEGQAPFKLKKLQAISDGRGEFAFRVPPTPMRYTVRVSAKG